MAVEKVTVAVELLGQALRLYYEKSYFAALHLAGAAEELFGAHLRTLGAQSSFDNFCTAGVELANAIDNEAPITRRDMEGLLNHAKNRTKHMDSAADGLIQFDPADEAWDLLDRAVTDYCHLMRYLPLVELPLVAQFNRELLERRR